MEIESQQTRRSVLGAAALAAMAGAYSPLATDALVIRTGSDGKPVRRAAKMGDAYLTSCVIRLDGDPNSASQWATRHDNNSHRSLNISGPPVPTKVNMVRQGQQVGGVLQVPFVDERPVAFAFAGPDEAFPALGVDVGVSGAVNHANLVFWHRAQSRYLDVTKASDRALAGGKSVNIWFVVISLAP